MRPRLVPLESYKEYPIAEMRRRTSDLLEEMRRRRTVRDFSSKPVPRDVVENCIRVAMTAPSGANRQPWHFVLVGDDMGLAHDAEGNADKGIDASFE